MLLFLHLAYDRAFAHSPTGLEALEVDGQNQEQDMTQILTSLQAADSAAKYIIKYCELGTSYSEQSLSHQQLHRCSLVSHRFFSRLF